MTDLLRPPKLAEAVLSFLLSRDDLETILGDFAELFEANLQQGSIRRAQIWYWLQIVKSAPSLAWLKFANQFQRSVEEMENRLTMHNKSSLWISLIALIPALLVIIPGIMQSGFGYFGVNDALDALYASTPALMTIINPILLLGGLFLAFILNAIPAVNVRLERQPDGLTGIITFKPVFLHWVFIGTSLLMVGVLLVYAFFENFAPILP